MDAALPPLLTIELLKLLIWLVAGMLLQLGLWLRRNKQHNTHHTIPQSVMIFFLLALYWYHFLTVIYPNTIMPELLLPTTLFCTIIIVVLVATQHFVAERWKKLLELWSMVLSVLLQLLLFMQPTTISIPLGLQLVLTGVIVAQNLTQLKALFTWLKQSER